MEEELTVVRLSLIPEIDSFVPQICLYTDIVRIIFHYVRLPTVLAMVCKQFRHWVDQIYPIRKEDWVNLIREERDDMITYLLHQGSIIPMKSFTYNLNHELVAKHRLDQK